MLHRYCVLVICLCVLGGFTWGILFPHVAEAQSVRSLAAPGGAEKLDPAGNAFFTRAGAGLIGTWNGSTSTADVDGDGDTDVLITGRTESGARRTALYLNDGSGRFTEQATTLPDVSERGSTAFTDLNGDTDPDVVLSGFDASGSPTTQVYLNDGSGGFSEQTGAGLPSVRNGDIAAVDVDADGDPDLLITGFTSSFSPLTALYLNDGSGIFTESAETFTDVWLSDATVGDVNGDGAPDFLVAGRGSQDAVTTVYTNDGSGAFTTSTAGLPAVSLPGLDLTDIDSDGDADAVITGQQGGTSITEVYVNDGTGSFSQSQSFTGVYVGGADFADVDTDGDADLFVSGLNPDGDFLATLYENDGTGTFTALDAGITGAGDSHQAFADVDGDGDLDLFVSGNDPMFGETSSRLYINRTNQDAQNVVPTFTFTPSRPSMPVTAGTPVEGLLEAGDLDGDVVSFSVAQAPVSSEATVTDASNGTAEFSFTPDASLVGQSVSAQFAVSDGNGGSATVSISVEVSSEFVPFASGLTGVFGPALAQGDVNGDGVVDLLIAGGDADSNPLTQLYVGDGSGSFVPKTGTGLPDLRRGSASLGDIDADGDVDLLLTGVDGTGTRQTGLFLNDGAGGFSPSPTETFTDVGFSKSSTLHDVDTDGDLDALVIGSAESGAGASNYVSELYLNDGAGGFVSQTSIVPPHGLSTVSRIDADDNGIEDLIFVGRDQTPSPFTDVYLAGFGGLTNGPSVPTQVAFGGAAGADFDGDGDEDLVVAGQEFSAEFNSGREYAQFYRKQFDVWAPASTNVRPLRYSTASAGDVDGDGDPDLIVGGRSNNLYKTYLYRTDPGAFSDYVRFPGVGTGGIAFADVDSDGDNDLIVIGNGQARVFENRLDPVSATSIKLVSSDQTSTFDDTGTRITFQGTDGGGDVSVDRFAVGPASTLGIDDDAIVSDYRFVIESEETLQFSPTTEIRLDVSTLGGISNPGAVSIYKRDEEGSGPFTELATTYDAAANELVAQVDGFSEFVLASTDPANPLPVELTQFRAVPNGTGILVEWATASETNNAGFTVEHQPPGTGGFTKVAERSGAGTTTVPQTYSMDVTDVERGTHRFRLRQSDVDGSESLSRTIEVTLGPDGAYALSKPSPNPTRSRAQMTLSVRKAQSVEVTLYNILGQRVAQLYDGRLGVDVPLRLQVDAERLPSGVYFVQVRGEAFQATRRMTVVR